MANSTIIGVAKNNLPIAAAGASFLQTPATLAAATAAFGVIAPEVVLPVTAIILACSAISSYFAVKGAEALVESFHHDMDAVSVVGADDFHAIDVAPPAA